MSRERFVGGRTRDVITIIGGGISGLAAAYELSLRQHPFVLLEAAWRTGGLIFTEQISGFTVDAGPDSILVQKRAAIELCEELGLGPRLMNSKPPRTAFVLKRGRLLPLPTGSALGIPTSVSALLRYDLLSWGARARLALEPFIRSGEHRDESVASFFRRRFGPEAVGVIAEPLLGGIHAGDVERLSMTSLFPRLFDAERMPGKVMRNLRGRSVSDSEGLFRALRGGMHELVSAIESRLPAGTIRLGSPAVGLDRSGISWQVHDPFRRHDVDAVIIAAPAHAAAACLQALDPEAARICSDVPYASTVSVALGYRRGDIDHPLEGSGFVVARRFNSLRITACTWVSSKWDSRAPPDRVLIRAFMGGLHDPEAVELPDDMIIDVAIRDLSTVLRIKAPALLSRVYRWKDAAAQHVVGHRARMMALDSRLHRLPGLFVAGSGFDSVGIPDCIANGRRAASSADDYVRTTLG